MLLILINKTEFSMKKLFVILGQNGSIGKALKKSLVASNFDVIGMNWNKSGRNSIKSNGLSSNKIKSAVRNKRTLIIIDCLLGSSNSQLELSTHIKLLKEFKRITGSKYYIYLSTYEVDIHHNTSYRAMKKIIEPIMIRNGSYIIRFGCLCKSKLNSSINLKRWKESILVDEKFRPIMLPYTYINDIIDTIININLNYKPQIIRCYSGTAHIALSIPSLKINLVRMESNNNSKIPIPIILISILLMPIIKLLKIFINTSKFIDILEKPRSLIDHQIVLRSLSEK